MMKIDVQQVNAALESAHPEEILLWAWNTFNGSVAASSSFQTQSVPLLKMISRVTPGMFVYFLDTGFHFEETLQFRDQLAHDFKLNVRSVGNPLGGDGFVQQYGPMFQNDPDSCCHLNKVEPMERARHKFCAWISGIRRDQTLQRRETPVITLLADGTYKICPLVNWTRDNIKAYAQEFNLPEHPLKALGYTSIGCQPCTQPVRAGEDERAGRWAGSAKTECGLHWATRGV